jgi:hypothetical protein
VKKEFLTVAAATAALLAGTQASASGSMQAAILKAREQAAISQQKVYHSPVVLSVASGDQVQVAGHRSHASHASHASHRSSAA